MTKRRVQADAVRQVDRSPGRALRLEQTYLVRTETVIEDPDATSPADMNPPIPPRENRATRRAKQRAARRTR